jgi:hypothetical protein
MAILMQSWVESQYEKTWCGMMSMVDLECETHEFFIWTHVRSVEYTLWRWVNVFARTLGERGRNVGVPWFGRVGCQN